VKINSDFNIDRVGGSWLVLYVRDGVVHNLTGSPVRSPP